MLIGENIMLALNGLLANKMRALLTMLGIIIGIGSVIAIMSVGNSISSSVTSSMEDMGVNNITLGVSQKSTSETSTADGRVFMGFSRGSTMDDEDYITDEMLDAMKEEFADSIREILLSESAGSGAAEDGNLTANVTLTGVNTAYLENEDLTLLAGRTLTETDQTKTKRVVLVSDKLADSLFDGDYDAAVKYRSMLATGTIATPSWASTNTRTVASPQNPTTIFTLPYICLWRQHGIRIILQPVIHS
mgnify:CR=1 FL=1